MEINLIALVVTPYPMIYIMGLGIASSFSIGSFLIKDRSWHIKGLVTKSFQSLT